LKKKLEVFHLHKLIKDKDQKIMDIKQMFIEIVGNDQDKLQQFAQRIDDNWKEYESDNSATQWNLPEHKVKKQKKGSRVNSPKGENENQQIEL
jgi:hypothetical protein